MTPRPSSAPRTHRGFTLRLAIALAGLVPAVQAGYRIEDVPYPAEIKAGIAAVTFTPAGALVIATRVGEIWIRRPSGDWRLFARGFDEPLGLVAESETRLFIAHRPELLRADDADGDGRAETFESIGGKWGITQNYHEFFYGLKRDRTGRFYGALALESTGAANQAQRDLYPTLPYRGTRRLENVLEPTGHRSEVPWRGWVISISPDGRLEPLAAGFRQANGIGLSPEEELFVTDNQGDYKPSTGLLHVAKGDFHGHASSLKWEPGFDPNQVTTESLWRRLKTPAVVFPHGPLGVSPGEPVWDLSGGKFGPYAGQVFTGDYSRIVIRAALEKVAGAWQGAAFPFLGRNVMPPYATGDKLKAGTTRGAFAPDGSLYLAATAGQGAGEDGLQRVSWDGQTSPDIRNIRLTDRGFQVSFTRPMQADTLAAAASYEITRFRYYYHHKYGSPWVDEARVAVKAVTPAADGLAATLELDGLQPGFVYEFSLPRLRTREGDPLANPLGYYTANRLPNGETAVGGTTRLPRPGETSLTSREVPGETAKSSTAEMITAGERVYRFYCVACHQPDGRGVAGGAANFVDDRSRLAKSDTQLLEAITNGVEAKGMPAFGAIINPLQRRAVLAYLRAKFGPEAASPPR
ncbi:MAG: c-type cytochrome [Opitutaceae bacterium]|nr:c-type cytochrome [Opitutaceae bacterium]